MFHLLLILSSFLLPDSATQYLPEKGDFVVGLKGNADFSFEGKSFGASCQIDPSALYFVRKRVGVGLAVSAVLEYYDRAWNTTAFSRYNIWMERRVVGFLQLGLGCGQQYTKNQITPELAIKSVNMLTIRPGVGLDYFIHPKWAIELFFSNSFNEYRANQGGYAYHLPYERMSMTMGFQYLF